MPSLMHCGILELLYKIGWLPEFTNMVTEKLSSLLRVTCSVHVGTFIMTQNPMFFSINIKSTSRCVLMKDRIIEQRKFLMCVSVR